MSIFYFLFGDRRTPGTSRHMKPSDGLESLHITVRDRAQRDRIKYLATSLHAAEAELADLRAKLEALDKENRVLREFYTAWVVAEACSVNSDLHDQAIARLSRAKQAVSELPPD